jgi:hypothetical protein
VASAAHALDGCVAAPSFAVMAVAPSVNGTPAVPSADACNVPASPVPPAVLAVKVALLCWSKVAVNVAQTVPMLLMLGRINAVRVTVSLPSGASRIAT